MSVVPEIIGPSTEAVNLLTWGGYQFAVWYTRAGELRIGRITRGTHRWGIDHQQYEFAGAPRTTLALPVANDEHNIAAIAVDGLGRLHVWANMHSAPMRAVRSVDPHTADTWLATAGWTSAAADFDQSAVDTTYPFPTLMPDGTVIFYMRSGTATSGSGRCDSFLYRRTPAGTTWSTGQTLFQGLSVPDAKGAGIPGDDSTVDTEYNWSAYPSGPLLCESPRHPHPGRLHCCWTWRLFAQDSDRINVLPSYGYSDDTGVTWKAVDGTALTVPITPLNATAARFPGHARFLSISRSTGIVVATLDQTAAAAGIQVGQSYVVQVPSDSSFDGTFTIAVIGTGSPLTTSQIVWAQGGANVTVNLSGYIGVDDYQNTQAVAIDDAGRPHILHSITPTWRTSWTGTTWTRSQVATTINGVDVAGAGANAIFAHRGDVWLLKARGGAGWRQPAAFNLDGPGVVTMGGPVFPFGGHEASIDPEAIRRFGTVEVLTCDGDRPRVYTFGRGSRAVAHVA